MIADQDSTGDARFIRYWGFLGVVTVLLLAFITPPFQVPDEAQHFFRAYQLSEGQFISEVRGATAGGQLPSSLQELSEHFLGTRKLHADRPIRPFPIGGTLAQLDRPLDIDKREFVVLTGAAAYGPLAYAPQILAIKMARMSNASVLTTFFLSRIANGLCALVLLGWAIWLMPLGRELIAFAALLPMAVYLYASASPDAMIVSSAFLYTSLILNRTATNTWSHRDTALAVATGATFCMIKPVYAPLLLLGFVQVFYARHRLVALLTHGGILVAACALTLLWGLYAASAIIPMPEGVSFAGQVEYILRDPLHYGVTLARSLLWRDFYYMQVIGTLGWLTFQLPAVAYWLPALAVVLALGSERNQWSRQSMAFVAAGLTITTVCVVLIMTALYVYWTPVGNVVVEGVQGRYFLPLLPLGVVTLLLAGRHRLWWNKSAARAAILGLIALEAGITIYTVSTTYQVIQG
jgi:uncharacterized membrane protein